MNALPARTDAVQHKADLLRSLRLSIIEGVFAMPIVTMSLPVNLFLTALVTKTYPLPKVAIGLVCALPFVANFLQVFALPFIARHRSQKTVTVWFAALHWVTWIAFAIMLSWLPRDRPQVAGLWIAGWFLLSSILSSVTGVSWNAWIQEWVPPSLRGKYFGRRNAILQVAVLLFILAAGWILARWDYAVVAFQGIVAFAVVTRLFSLRWLALSPTRPHRRHSTPPPLTLRQQLEVLRRSRSLLAFIAFGATWAFAANCFGPFYHVFMFEELDLSSFDVGVLVTLSQLGGALSLPAWGQLLDRHGNKPVMVISLLLWQGQNFAWYWIGPDNRELLYAMWTWAGITGAGFVLGQFTMLLRLIPVEARNLAIGVNVATVSLVAAVAPVLGGWALSRGLQLEPDALAVYHLCFLLQPLVAIAACFILLRVHEPKASSLTMVFGAMRNIRTLSAMLGLGWMVNYVFFKAPRRGPRPPP